MRHAKVQSWSYYFLVCRALRDLVSLYKLKNMKNTHGGVKVTLLHRCFSHFLNCTNGIKLPKALHIFLCNFFLVGTDVVRYANDTLPFSANKLRENFPNKAFFLVHFFPYSIQTQENMDQKKFVFGTFHVVMDAQELYELYEN